MRAKVWLQVNWVAGRGAALAKLVPEVREIWARGGAVVVHCNQGFHRSPIGAAILRVSVCGGDLGEVLRTFADGRRIWPGLFREGYQPVVTPSVV